jgi:CheY-like chemotaxis protein
MSHKVFLVVHDPELCRTVTAALRSCGCGVYACPDARKAISIIPAGNPDLIVCQDEMPRIAGRQLGRLFKAHGALSRIPFLLLSETLPPVDRRACARSRLEADQIVRLPLDPARFSETLRRWLPPENRPDETATAATEDARILASAAPRPSGDLLFMKIMAEAECLLRASAFARAREPLHRAVTLNPASSLALARLAWTDYLVDGATNSAAAAANKDLLKKALALDDTNAEAYLYLGKILQAEGKQGLAEVMFARAAKLNSALPEVPRQSKA